MTFFVIFLCYSNEKIWGCPTSNIPTFSDIPWSFPEVLHMNNIKKLQKNVIHLITP